ncbi:MAG: hypothetical protein IPK31_04260 [Chitinophagaceae bacterium]|nr:hypothetical protein [Chitinophagaceae bacterium]
MNKRKLWVVLKKVVKPVIATVVKIVLGMQKRKPVIMEQHIHALRVITLVGVKSNF